MSGMLLQINAIQAYKITAIIAAVALLITLAIQYPLSVTFPMGGDAPAYLEISQKLRFIPSAPTNISTLTNSWYPGAHLLLLPFSFLPVSWPMKFVWWAAVGQIAVGLSLGWMLYRLFNWRTAFASMAFWAITPITATPHFEDGTIAQLWSYVFLFLFIERFNANKPWQMLSFLSIASLTHPVGAMVAVLSTSLASPFLLTESINTQSKERRTSIILLISTALIAITTAAILASRSEILLQITSREISQNILGLFPSYFYPLLFLSPLGASITLRKLASRPQTLNLITAFLVSSFLLGTHFLLGPGTWEKRFTPLFVICVVILASIAMPHLLSRLLKWRLTATLATVVFIGNLGVNTWYNNAYVYNYYESSSRYARVHPDEIAAIEWMKTGLPNNSTIYSVSRNRHNEWIKVLTSHNCKEIPPNGVANYFQNTSYPRGSYLAFFTMSETPPEEIRENPERYLPIYENKAVYIVRLPLQ